MSGASGATITFIDIARSETPIYRTASVTGNGTTALYTVPLGSTLYLTFLEVSTMATDGVNLAQPVNTLEAFISWTDGSNAFRVTARSGILNTSAAPNENLSSIPDRSQVNPTLPIRISAGTVINLTFTETVIDGSATGTIQGWLE